MRASWTPAPVAPAQAAVSVRDPDVFLAWASLLVVAFSAVQIALLAFGRDQGIYAVVGGGLARGLVPYRDLWDFKPPGIYAVYGLAEVLFGRTMASVRILEVIGLGVLTFTLVELARELTASRTAGLVGAALAALIHAQLEFWHSGQPETFAGFVTLVAVLVTVRSRAWTAARAVWGGRIFVGVCFGLAFLFKPPLGGGVVVCAAYLARDEVVRSTSRSAALAVWLVVGAASVLPILLTIGWFVWAGGIDAMRWTLLEFVPGYTAISSSMGGPLAAFYYGFQEAFTGFSAVLPAGALCAVVLRPIHSREREGLLLLFGIICMHVAGIAMQGKFFQYHYAATLPLIAALAGIGLYKAWRRVLRFGVPGIAAFALTFGLLVAMRDAVRNNPGTFWERSVSRARFLLSRDRTGVEADLYRVADYDLGQDRLVAEHVAARTKAGEHIYVWGFEPVIYWLADRSPSSRFIYDVPQRATWNRERARRELLEDLRKRPPAAVVVQHGDRFHWVTGDELDSAEALDTFPELNDLLEREMTLDRVIGDFDVYLRRAHR